MAFFQNPFFEEFRGTWPLGDRSSAIPMVILGNAGRNFDLIAAFNSPVNSVYDLSGNDSNGDAKSNLSIRFAYRDFSRFVTLSIDVSGTDPANTTISEIINNLNGDELFSTYFTASWATWTLNTPGDGNPNRIIISSKKTGQVKFYIENTGAEEALGFNKKAGVADLPTYFGKYTVDNGGLLLPLSHDITLITKASPAVITSTAHGLKNNDNIVIARSDSNAPIDGAKVVTVLSDDTFTAATDVLVTAGDAGFWAKAIDANIIANAINPKGISYNYSLSTVKFDWELLEGRSGVFMFYKNVIDGSNRVVESIQYPAGSEVGDLAKKIINVYNGAALAPDTSVEIPYTLTSADLITP